MAVRMAPATRASALNSPGDRLSLSQGSHRMTATPLHRDPALQNGLD